MRVTVSINREQYPELIDHLEDLRAQGKNISRFFSEAGTAYVKEKNQVLQEGLRRMVLEIIEDEGLVKPEKDSPLKPSQTKDQEDFKKRINAVFENMENL